MFWGLQFAGWFGELKTVIAKKLFLRSSDYVDLNNVTIRTRRGTTQIDHVIVSRYGVFVVETKNMSGWIFGTSAPGGWVIFSQFRHEYFSRTCRTTFHWRATSSRLSVTSSPSL